MTFVDVALFVCGEIWEYDLSTIECMVEQCGQDYTIQFFKSAQNKYGIDLSKQIEFAERCD
tara:strand:- start:924 stop:1106 length:183 start_codon:yes stop_codon:yes gene_type:complete